MKQTYNDNLIEIDSDFSNKDFLGRRDIPIPNNINVYGSCFSNETPDTKVFPDTMTGVTFYNCNLDNVIIPAGNTVIGGSNKRFKVQNDLNDWIIGVDDKPTMPVNYKVFTKFGLPMPLVKDIPLVKVDTIIDLQKVAEDKLAEIII